VHPANAALEARHVALDELVVVGRGFRGRCLRLGASLVFPPVREDAEALVH
jgi:hypothetical protein